MIKHEIKIAFEEYASIDELRPADRRICLEAEKALGNSHSPYSNFKVGAALQLQSGRVVSGSNQENASLSLRAVCRARGAVLLGR
ncbi:hypothetical protein [Mucilaginibacter sp.]